MSTTMASAIFTPSHSCPPTKCGYSTSVSTHSKTLNTCPLKSIPQLGLIQFSQWSGLKHLGCCSIVHRPVKRERKRLCRGKVVHASLFGVGAPEALVIGVVALLVFGPKGLAEVARNLGKTLRAFQPTIRELQDVSREFKSTLEREIGLDEIQSSTQNPNSSNVTKTTSIPTQKAGPEEFQSAIDPNGTSSSSKAYSSEDYLKFTEEQLKAIAAQQQTQTSPVGESPLEPQTQSQDSAPEAATTVPIEQKPENKT